MIKKIIVLILFIIVGVISYKYFLTYFPNVNEVINIEADDNQYKFEPNDTEGKNFNGDNLEIYKVTREKLLPPDEGIIENDIPVTQSFDKNEGDLKDNTELKDNNIYLQLASYKTMDKAKLFVENFKENKLNIIKELGFNIVAAKLENRGTFYRVRLGPFNNNEEILTLCIELRLVNNECLIVKDD